MKQDKASKQGGAGGSDLRKSLPPYLKPLSLSFFFHLTHSDSPWKSCLGLSSGLSSLCAMGS